MDQPRRFTMQMKQEEISRYQLCERLINFGWLATAPKDLGEDFIVHIYFEERATGVTFHVQEKSVTNLVNRRKQEYLPYSLEVKDLIHWRNFSLPVVLIVWDVHLREGRWSLIHDLISDIDHRLPNWQKNKTVTVRIPWANNTSDDGLTRLRQEIGGQLFPIIAQGKELEFEVIFDFSDTDEGMAAKSAFDKLIREGEQATFKGRSIKSINVSDWAKPWIALYSSENAALILEPILPSDPVNVELTIISDDDTSASISNIELRHIKFGSDVKQLSNEHQNTSLHFTLTLHTVERSLTFTAHLNNLGDNAYEAREVMKFLEALAIGGVLRICFLNHNNNVIEIPIDPQIDKISDPEGIKVIEQVCKIQDKMRRFIRIPNDEWPIEDIRGIGRLSRIVQFGSLKGRAEDFTINFPRMNLQIVLDGYSAGNRILFRINYPECVIEIFNNKIDAGSIIRYLTCAPKLNVDDIRELINSTNDDELQIEFTDVDVVDIFPERFLHEASMLARKLIRQYRGARIYYYSFIVWDAFAQINNSIELAVQGLTMTDIIEARKILASETSFPFNIVDIDDTPSDLREHILTKGRII